MCFFTNKKGFSLFELLVAIGIGSIVVLGVFETFKTVIKARESLTERNVEVIAKIVLLLQKDIRCKVGKFELNTEGDTQKLSFYTTNSLFFSGAVPVKVSYFLNKEEGKNLFCREEVSEEAGVDFTIPLTDLLEKVEYKFLSQGEWRDTPSEVVKISLYTKDASYYFVQRSVLEQ